MFHLPDASDTLIAEATQVDENRRVGFQWFGRFINSEGYLMFNHKNGLTSGYVLKGSDIFELIPMDSNYQFLIQRSTVTSEGECGVPAVQPPPDITETPPDCEYSPSYNTCPAIITVLVIIDEYAKAYLETLWGGVDFFLFFGEAIVNQAFYNSDIPNKEIRVKYIEKSEFDFSDPINLLDDLDELSTWSQQERSDNKADLVVLLTGEHYPGGIFGVATLSGAPSFASAFTIIEAQGFINAAGFPHELGHLFGCRHNWRLDLGNDDTEICAHAYRHLTFFDPPPNEPWELPTINSWRTIVGVTINADLFELNEELYHWNESWIMHYSNPYVNYYTTATGRPPTGPATDNAQQIRDNGCDIADFFPNQELGVFIDYTPVGCNYNKTFTAGILEPESGLPGVPPYTVSWYSNNSGVFQYPGQNIQFLGTGSSITLTQNPHCPVYWIKCIVQSSDDVVVSRILRVELGPINCCSDDPEEGGGEEGGEGFTGGASDRNPAGSGTNPINIRFYPNPNNGDQLILEGEGTEHLTGYELTDLTGRSILQNATNLQVGNQQQRVSIQLPDIESGIYFLRLSGLKPSCSVSKLFIIKP